MRQWLEWRDQGIDTSIAFNISALSLEQLDFPDLVERMCRALDVPIDRLVLELTEGATQPLIKLMDTLTRFRIKGIGLAIDDFGTGYSSLMQLRQLPFTEVKIDQSFIADAAALARLPADHPVGHRPRPRARPHRDCGGRRDARPIAPGARARLRPRPGLSDLAGAGTASDLKAWKQKFRRSWPAMIAEAPLALWGDVEADSLGERQI